MYGHSDGKKTPTNSARDHYVYIFGLDAYINFVDHNHIKGYTEVAQIQKQIGFTEYGPHGALNPARDYDYRQFLEGVKKDFPKAVFFMSWDAKWSLARNNNVKELLAGPWIVNRADLPAGLTGAGK